MIDYKLLIDTLTESFRDYNEDIEEIESRLYDLNIELQDAEDWEDTESIKDIRSQIDSLNKQLDELQGKKDEEYNEEIKDLPKPTNKTSFEGFDITSTDPSFDSMFIPGNKDRQYALKKYKCQDSWIAEVTPDEYILLCCKYGWKTQYNTVEEIWNLMSKQSKENVHQYAERFKKGEIAPMPVINIKTQNQEGRHRAFDAK